MTPVRVGLLVDRHFLFSPRHANTLAGLDVIVLPELHDGGYAAIRRGARPHRAGDPFFSDFVTVSMTSPYCIVAGSTYFTDRSGPASTCFVFHYGRLIHRYDKIHLFRPARDDRYFNPGRTITPFVLNAGGHRLRAGIVICYDLRFPELVRSLAQQGMRILFVPARWPASRDDAWRVLLKARAIENQIFVVGCNAPGPEGGASYGFDPLGRMIFSGRLRGKGGPAAVTLDLDLIAEAHALHTNLDDALLLRERPPIRLLRTPKARRRRTPTRR